MKLLFLAVVFAVVVFANGEKLEIDDDVESAIVERDLARAVGDDDVKESAEMYDVDGDGDIPHRETRSAKRTCSDAYKRFRSLHPHRVIKLRHKGRIVGRKGNLSNGSFVVVKCRGNRARFSHWWINKKKGTGTVRHTLYSPN